MPLPEHVHDREFQKFTDVGGTPAGRVTGPGAANLGTGQVSVGTSSTQIVAARAGRRAVTIVNHGTTDVYVGLSGVTTGSGLLLTGTKGAAVTVPTSLRVDGVVASGSQTVSYLEEYD